MCSGGDFKMPSFPEASDLMLRGIQSALRNLELYQAFDRPIEKEPSSICVAIFLRVMVKLWVKSIAPDALASKNCFSLALAALGMVELDPQLTKEDLIHWEERLISAGLFKRQWYTSIEILEARGGARNVQAERNLAAVSAGRFRDLADQIIDAEKQSKSSPIRRYDGEELAAVRECLWVMLASMDRHIIEACITSTLPRYVRVPGSAVKEALDLLHQFGDKITGQYGNWETDGIGMSPTAKQYLRYTTALERYTQLDPTPEDNLWAAAVDSLSPLHSWDLQWSAQGYRRWMDYELCKLGNLKHSNERRKIALGFGKELRTRCEVAIDTDMGDCPFEDPLVEIGYSKELMTRQTAHKRRSLTCNYLMGLTDALLEALYGEGFGLTQANLLLIWTPLQCYLGEIALTYLCQAKPKGGLGFSHYQAGLSNSSAHKGHSERLWDEHRELVLTEEVLERISEAREVIEKEDREEDERKQTLGKLKEAVAEQNKFLEAALVKAGVTLPE